jgi:hypothetical protein
VTITTPILRHDAIRKPSSFSYAAQTLIYLPVTIDVGDF